MAWISPESIVVKDFVTYIIFMYFTGLLYLCISAIYTKPKGEFLKEFTCRQVMSLSLLMSLLYFGIITAGSLYSLEKPEITLETYIGWTIGYALLVLPTYVGLVHYRKTKVGH
jgi:hypothetical protein